MSDGTPGGPAGVDTNRARPCSKREIYEAWRAKYQGDWAEGKRRVDIVKKVLQDAGHAVCSFGFYAESTQMAHELPEETGVPDLRVVGLLRDIFNEVTGTQKLKPEAALWFRPDKVWWAQKHLDKETWGAHVITMPLLVRFVRLINPSQYLSITVPIEKQGVRSLETFLEIPASDAWSADQFLIYLDSLRPPLSKETKSDPEKSKLLSEFM